MPTNRRRRTRSRSPGLRPAQVAFLAGDTNGLGVWETFELDEIEHGFERSGAIGYKSAVELLREHPEYREAVERRLGRRFR